MGQVWLAQSTSQTAEVAAIKVIETADRALLDRFATEALVLRRLEHPAIVGYLGSGSLPERSLFYLAMDHIDGEDLGKVLDRGPMEVDAARRVFRDIADALRFAHLRGVYHRDLKPQNIMVRSDGSGCVIDLGIARQRGLPRQTSEGVVAGTLAYLPPEVFRDGVRSDDLLSDVYALGLLLYESLTGRRAFGLDEGTQQAHAVVRLAQEKTRSSPFDPGPSFPADLRDITRRATHPDPELRLASMDKLAERLGVSVPTAPGRAKAGTVWLDHEGELVGARTTGFAPQELPLAQPAAGDAYRARSPLADAAGTMWYDPHDDDASAVPSAPPSGGPPPLAGGAPAPTGGPPSFGSSLASPPPASGFASEGAGTSFLTRAELDVQLDSAPTSPTVLGGPVTKPAPPPPFTGPPAPPPFTPRVAAPPPGTPRPAAAPIVTAPRPPSAPAAAEEPNTPGPPEPEPAPSAPAWGSWVPLVAVAGLLAMTASVAAIGAVAWVYLRDPSVASTPPTPPPVATLEAPPPGEPTATRTVELLGPADLVLWVDGARWVASGTPPAAQLSVGKHVITVGAGTGCEAATPEQAAPCCARAAAELDLPAGETSFPWTPPTPPPAASSRSLSLAAMGARPSDTLRWWINDKPVPAGETEVPNLAMGPVSWRLDVGSCSHAAAGCSAAGSCPAGCASSVGEVTVTCGDGPQSLAVDAPLPNSAAAPSAAPPSPSEKEPHKEREKAPTTKNTPAEPVATTPIVVPLDYQVTIAGVNVDKGLDGSSASGGVSPRVPMMEACFAKLHTRGEFDATATLQFKVDKSGVTSDVTTLASTGSGSIDGCATSQVKAAKFTSVKKPGIAKIKVRFKAG